MPPDQPRPGLILKHWFYRDILCSGWKWQSEEPKDVSLKVMRFRARQWDFAGIGRLFTWYLSKEKNTAKGDLAAKHCIAKDRVETECRESSC